MFYQRTNRLQRRQFQQRFPAHRSKWSLNRLNELLADILPANRFYRDKLGMDSLQLQSLDQLSELPLTAKHELIADNPHDDFATNMTFPLDRYCRLHRTSGTRGRPLIVVDTPEDWQWWMECWQSVLDSAELTAKDRVMLAFSFGPFIGFWSAFDAVVERECLTIPTGSLSSLARLRLLESVAATVVCCTPSYALHLAEIAEQHHLDLAASSVRALIVAGEPGGSLPAVRQQIESRWSARVIDHSGASEVGPWGFADRQGLGLHVNEAHFLAEFLSLQTQQPASDGELSELVLTTLGRVGSPVIRYRTGDLVRPRWNVDPECGFVLLDGGVLGRTDDMMIIRGVNVFPSSIEQILRGFPEIAEFRLTAYKDQALDQLKIEIEDRLQSPQRVVTALQNQLGLRVDVQCVPLDSLPRFEAKAKRFVDQR